MAERESGLLEVTGNDSIENMYLTFEVEKETYAVNIACVTEIVGMQRISEIPDVPNYIKGAMNLRGKVIPVMDQRLRFQLPARAYDDRTTIIVLDLEGVPTGLVVDLVTDVLTIPQDKIEPPPHWLNSGKQGVIKGLGKLNDNVSIILDVPHLLYDKELHVDTSKVAANVQAESEPSAPKRNGGRSDG
ncbi:Chemotaxis protein CheW [Anaerolineae bacterium]|nr:Chemotaxis protein CheW [Anaerolineae bacterium]